MENLVYFTFDCDYFQTNQEEESSSDISDQDVSSSSRKKSKSFIPKLFQKLLLLYEQQESHWDKKKINSVDNQDEEQQTAAVSSSSSSFSGKQYHSSAILSWQKAVFFQFLAILPPSVKNELLFPDYQGREEDGQAKDKEREKFLKPVFSSSYLLNRNFTHTSFSESLKGMLQEHIAANPSISSLSAAHQITFFDHFKGLPSGILPMDIAVQKEWKILAFLEILDRGKEKWLPGDEMTMMNRLTRAERLKQLLYQFYYPNSPVIYINKATISSRNRVIVAREVIKSIVFPQLEEKIVGKGEKKKEEKPSEALTDTDGRELDAIRTLEDLKSGLLPSEKKETGKNGKDEGIVFIGFEANPKEVSEWETKQKEMERQNEAEKIRNPEKEINLENERNKMLNKTTTDTPNTTTPLQSLKEEKVAERKTPSILSDLRRRSMEKKKK
jgi:hypothetical protein